MKDYFLFGITLDDTAYDCNLSYFRIDLKAFYSDTGYNEFQIKM